MRMADFVDTLAVDIYRLRTKTNDKLFKSFTRLKLETQKWNAVRITLGIANMNTQIFLVYEIRSFLVFSDNFFKISFKNSAKIEIINPIVY